MTRCPRCRGRAFSEATRTIRREVAGHLFRATVPARECDKCGEGYFDLAALRVLDRKIAAEFARAGSASGVAFKAMRKALGMRAADLAPLIGVAPETISRWETGRRAPDLAAAEVLASMVLDQEEGRRTTRDRVEAFRRPRRVKTTVRLAWGRERA